MYYLLLFHSNRCYINMPQFYITHMSSVLFEYETVAVTLSTVLLLEWLLGLPDECSMPRRGFTVLTMGNMKTVVFWVVILCIVHLVSLFQRNMFVSAGWKEEAGTRYLKNVGILSKYKVLHPRRYNCCLEDRGNKFLRNVSTYFYIPDCTVAYPRSATSFTPKIEATGLSKVLVCCSQISTNICEYVPYIHDYILEDHMLICFSYYTW